MTLDDYVTVGVLAFCALATLVSMFTDHGGPRP